METTREHELNNKSATLAALLIWQDTVLGAVGFERRVDAVIYQPA